VKVQGWTRDFGDAYTFQWDAPQNAEFPVSEFPVSGVNWVTSNPVVMAIWEVSHGIPHFQSKIHIFHWFKKSPLITFKPISLNPHFS
jgi:hypothetical protein